MIYSNDLTADVDHLYDKRIHLVDFIYIIIEDMKQIVHTRRLYYQLVINYGTWL
jgi:hypothetical protein